MAAALNSPPSFPLFAPMQVEEDPSKEYDYLMCLWRNENPDAEEFCAQPLGDFFKLLPHLRQEHSLDLKNCIDYCFECEVIFGSRLECLSHFLSKALSSQHFIMTCEKDSEEVAALNEWLRPLYEKLNDVHKDIMDKVLFSDDLPPLEDYVNVEVDEHDRSMTEDLPDTQVYGFDEVDYGRS